MPPSESEALDDDRIPRAFRIAYDGADYHGFQRQPTVRTVSGAIIDAFRDFGIEPIDAGYAAAGRTDAGVSAAAQTIALTVPTWLDAAALDGRLPDDVHAWAGATVEPDFHPRYDAVEREYSYHLVGVDIDIEQARRAAATLCGRHDFRDLSAATERTVRRLDRLELHPRDDCVTVIAAAPSFLHQQIRRIVTVLVLVGSGERSVGAVDELLDPARRSDGPDGIEPAPPEPLTLRDVRYPAVCFRPDAAARDRAMSAFADRRDHHRGRAGGMNEVAARLRGSRDQHL